MVAERELDGANRAEVISGLELKSLKGVSRKGEHQSWGPSYFLITPIRQPSLGFS